MQEGYLPLAMGRWDYRISHNDPFGSRPEPRTHLIAFILLLSPGEVPEGPARADQDTATSVQSESEL